MATVPIAAGLLLLVPGCGMIREVQGTQGWSSGPGMAVGREGHTATRLLDGRVLVAGGYGDKIVKGERYLEAVEVYDPVADAWSPLPPLAVARADHGAALLPDGRVLIAGGKIHQDNFSENDAAAAEVFDPRTANWSKTAPNSPYIANRPVALSLTDGRVMLLGIGSPVRSFGAHGTQIYDPDAGTWTSAGSLSGAHPNGAAAALADGRVLVAGGEQVSPTGPPATSASASAEIWNPASGTWSAGAPLSQGRAGHTATVLPDGRVLIAGGFNLHGSLAESVDVAGGFSYSQGSLVRSTVDVAEIYDPQTDSWSTTGSLRQGRSQHTAALLGDGKVLVVGGSSSGWLPSAELYDPADGTWRSAGEMWVGRYGESATVLADGRLLVAGGRTAHPGGAGGAPISAVEVYEPQATGAAPQPPVLPVSAPIILAGLAGLWAWVRPRREQVSRWVTERLELWLAAAAWVGAVGGSFLIFRSPPPIGRGFRELALSTGLSLIILALMLLLRPATMLRLRPLAFELWCIAAYRRFLITEREQPKEFGSRYERPLVAVRLFGACGLVLSAWAARRGAGPAEMLFWLVLLAIVLHSHLPPWVRRALVLFFLVACIWTLAPATAAAVLVAGLFLAPLLQPARTLRGFRPLRFELWWTERYSRFVSLLPDRDGTEMRQRYWPLILATRAAGGIVALLAFYYWFGILFAGS